MRAADGHAPSAPTDATERPIGASGRSVVAEAERHLATEDYSAAVLEAFPRVMTDVARAYGTHFPAHWTARDVIAHGLRSDTGALPDLLRSLYELYEPVRYGPAARPTNGALLSLLERVYARTALHSLPLASPGSHPPAEPYAWYAGARG